LEKEPDKRPNANDLLDHAFLASACAPEEFSPIIEDARQASTLEAGDL